MIEIGRICIKTAGRDAGRECVVVDIMDDSFVLIDGNTRRRKCNIMHLEPTQQIIKIRKNASHEDIAAEFKSLGFSVWDTKAREGTAQPTKARSKGKKASQPEKAVKGKEKKAPKKEDKKAEPKKKTAAKK